MSLRSRVEARAVALRSYCEQEGYNTHLALFVDLSRHSGRCRFMAWDFEQNRPILSSPVSHGSGSQRSHRRSAYARLSNEDGSHLSSVGRALVAERYEGSYGIAYRLDGLESTNSNLRSRCVVLHGWSYTTTLPIFPIPTVGSFGCPVLSKSVMARVDELLRNQSRVILEVFV
jgi:hypothetical protein